MLGAAGSLLPTPHVAQAVHLFFSVEHLEEVAVVGLQLVWPVGLTVRHRYHLWWRCNHHVTAGQGVNYQAVIVTVTWSNPGWEQCNACSSDCFPVTWGGVVAWDSLGAHTSNIRLYVTWTAFLKMSPNKIEHFSTLLSAMPPVMNGGGWS